MNRGAQALAVIVTLATAVAVVRPADAKDDSELRAAVRRLTAESGAPGALAAVRDRHGRTVITSGVGDLRTGAPVPRNARFRVGSVTKTFVAAVILQLVGEGRVALDAPVEDYLPGLIRGNDNDGREISVRQLLQHRSGLPDYLTYLTPQAVIDHPFEHRDKHQLLRIALDHPRLLEPGERFAYSNTNYLVAGLIAEKATGRPLGEEIRRRILRPLRLSDTSVPGDETGIGEPHPQGYIQAGPDGPRTEFTRYNPSVAWASGDMISSGRDLNRFFAALLGGRLLGAAEQREMLRAPTTGRQYGLGIERHRLPSGIIYWGNDGDSLGFSTKAGATMDGRQVTVMVNLNPGGSDAQDDNMRSAIAAALREAS